MSRYRKRQLDVEAWQWAGGEYDWLEQVLGHNWGRADAHDVEWGHDDGEQVVIWNTLERIWLPVPVGHWIIRGIRGEFYPCNPEVFAASYFELAS